jgi:hypothetical protein
VAGSGVKWRVRLKPAVQRSAPKTRTSRKAFSTNTPFCVRRACRFATPGDEVRLRERLNGNVHLAVNAPGTRPLGSFGPAIRTNPVLCAEGPERKQGLQLWLFGDIVEAALRNSGKPDRHISRRAISYGTLSTKPVAGQEDRTIGGGRDHRGPAGGGNTDA